MLELKLVRDNPDLVREDLKRRGQLDKLALVDELLEKDREWRKLLAEANLLRAKRNKLNDEIAALRRSGKDASALMREAEGLPDEIAKVEGDAEGRHARVTDILMRLPNLMHESVPFGVDENDNVELRSWGEPRRFSFPAKDHQDLAKGLGLMDLERAGKVAGSRFYYLRGDLVSLNYALLRFGLDFLERRGFSLIQPPYLLRREAIGGAVALSDFEDVIYKVEGEDLYLLPTSEHAILAQHMDEILDGRRLPLRYAGVSPCFRKEAGAHGRDTKGIFRVHQFEKVEQFVFCKPEDSWNEHERLISNAEEFYKLLKIPYRIVNVCTGDLGTVAAKKYDLEAWLPGQNKYREVVSCSNCSSYQAVRSRIRYRDRPNEETRAVHTLNSTLLASERALIAIMENCQSEDGSISIPEALQGFMNGATKLRPTGVGEETEKI